nr:hypothetical protein [uncultured Capnocytophaga sp.]
MRTVLVIKNKLVCFLVILFLLSCTEREVRKAERENPQGKYYEIDVFGDSKKELFLVEDKLFVGDSCLGTFSEENYQKAYQYYLNTKEDVSMYLIYEIKIQDDKTKDFITLWEVCEYNPETFRRIVLDQDYTYKDNLGEKIDKKLLKVISKNRNGGLFAYCFNFEIDVTFNWKVYSKERVSLPYGYCKDTIYTDLNNRGNDTPDNVIIFGDTFDESGLWICNGDNLK